MVSGTTGKLGRAWHRCMGGAWHWCMVLPGWWVVGLVRLDLGFGSGIVKLVLTHDDS